MKEPLSDRDPLVGTSLGRYRIVEKIGAGGMGKVYRAHDERLERDVALKVLRSGTLADEAARKRFRKEALALSKLNHPGIATIFDFDTQQGVDFLVMEYVAGTTLSEKLREGPLTEEEAARLGQQLAEGLVAAHEQGIIHRDLKPGNVRLTPDGRLKILDFGLAKLVRQISDTAETASMTDARALMGTPAYIAPEQLRGRPVDPRTDIWAAGMVLYEMLTGQHPFRGTSHDRLFHSILHEDPPAISKLRPEVPRRLEEITIRALEKRPEDRYPSASALAEDLGDMLRLLETPSELPRGGRVFSRRAKRRRAWIATGLVAVLTVVTFVVIQRLSVQEAAATQAIAVLPLASLVGDDVVDLQTRIVARMLTTDLGESSHIRVLGAAALQTILTNRKLLAASEFTTGDLRNIARSANLSHIVTLSFFRGGDKLRADIEIIHMPDGQTVATGSEEVVGEDNLVSMIDPLASKTRGALLSEEQLASELDRPFGDITSISSQAVAFFYQAREFEFQGNLIRAVELYDKALEADPDFFLARVHRALNVEGTEFFIEVENIEKLSDYERLLLDAQRAFATEDFPGLLALTNEMLTLRRGDWLSLNFKYVAEYFLGLYEQAAETCEYAIRTGYRGYYEHLLLNGSYAMSGLSATQIVERYQSFLEQDPSDAMMKFWLAVTYLTLNRDSEAQELLNSVFEVCPENDGVMSVVADTYVWREASDKTADYERALAYLRRMREIHVARFADAEGQQGDFGIYDWLRVGIPFSFKMGEIHLLQGNINKAISAYERSLKLKPDHYNSFYRLGLAYDRKGVADKAIANFEKYIDVTDLNAYDATALGRENSCAASKVCHSISRPVALADARQRIERLR